MKHEVVKTFFARAEHFKSINIIDGSFVFEFNSGHKFHFSEWKSGTAFFEEKNFKLKEFKGFEQELSCKEDLSNLSESCKLVCVHLFEDGKSALQGVDDVGFGVEAGSCFRNCRVIDGAIKSVARRSALDFDIQKSKVITYEQTTSIFHEPN